MITVDDSTYLSFCRFLDSEYPANKDVYVYIHNEHTTIIDEDMGQLGFGAYFYDEENDKGEIHVATLAFKEEMETEIDFLMAVYTTIAHEYAHHLQYTQGKRVSEREAEEFAEQVVGEFLGYQLVSLL